MPEKDLTDKEKKVIEAFESARPGLGAIVESNIRNNDKTGWAESIASLDESEIKAGESTATNSFMYRRIGG
jgi:hypothetical protein